MLLPLHISVARSRLLAAALALAATAALPATTAHAFCGFYVAKADAGLFNEASQVVLVRDGDKTTLTMVNDFQGPVKEFAVVIPVPTVITKSMITIGDDKVVKHLDAYTAPRLVEYHDADPCNPIRYRMEDAMAPMAAGAPMTAEKATARARALGVTIEASYTVGEYDILILSAKQSDGLETWLKESGYRIPDGASEVLGSYIKQEMKFFVAKVNLAEHDKKGGGTLRPITVRYTSPKFMLPIRLGTVNAKGDQDLIIFALTQKGRVETTNYRTLKLPSDMNIPEYTQDVFPAFYKSLFETAVKKADGKAVFTEYAWDMAWCDPCAADPLSPDELEVLGVDWTRNTPQQAGFGGNPVNVFVTRLHVRYDGKRFPEDLVFQETSDRSNFQGRYVLQRAWKGELKCDEAKSYKEQVATRRGEEAKTLAEITGWKLSDIHAAMTKHLPRYGVAGGPAAQDAGDGTSSSGFGAVPDDGGAAPEKAPSSQPARPRPKTNDGDKPGLWDRLKRSLGGG